MQSQDISQLGLDQVIQLAEQFQRDGNFAAAVALYECWTDTSSSSERHVGLFNLGVIQLNLGDIDAAERTYRLSLDLFPGFSQARINLGLLLELGNRFGLLQRMFACQYGHTRLLSQRQNMTHNRSREPQTVFLRLAGVETKENTILFGNIGGIELRDAHGAWLVSSVVV